ncbi:hypothetical protein GS399_13210 [Pedobacter sp. HMF7647]|uniref:Uncharacterized protein n=1 Tax=Hufsiella arboris TaxID=2695275 RepID=A0A7K1YBI2_9SPHI|nr:hypothetical protein [Hufsiella arboris]MXV51935.1 hypothetical protein [Hufsiella arboris]
MKAKSYLSNANWNFIRLAIFSAIFVFQQMQTSWAQSTANVSKKSEITLSSFEGFYRFPNQVAYVQFYQKDGKLMATQLWDKKQYEMIRKSELEFETSEGYTAKFIADKGDVNAMMLNGRILLRKVNYNPEQKMALEIEQLKKLEGRYQFQKDAKLSIEVIAEKGGLILHQLWDGKNMSFYPRSEVDFFNDELTFPLHFVVENEQVKQMTCFGNDKWNKLN